MASREIFVDTSGLYALVDRKAAHHPAARAVVERLLRSGRRLLATDYVVAETVKERCDALQPGCGKVVTKSETGLSKAVARTKVQCYLSEMAI